MSYLDLDNHQAYRRWAENKRRAYDQRGRDDFALLVEVNADGRIPPPALAEVQAQIGQFNFALYRMNADCQDSPKAIKALGKQLGLQELDRNLCAQEDRLTRLTVADDGRARQYIPYSNKAIGWHTDGYYNPLHQRVLAMVLHCEQPAESGGVNDLLDHEMAYIHLRDTEPAYIEALSQPRVMCIPENVEGGELVRPQTCSAVFLAESQPGGGEVLAMRFSKRKRHIIWADDVVTREALDCLFEFLESDSPYHVRYRLNAGEGVISNNVLHTRSGFTDSAAHKRVYYRARYYNRIHFS